MPRIAFLLDKEWKFAPETPELATFQQVSHADSYGLAKADEVIFEVQPVAAPRFLYAAVNRVVDGWTASPVFDTAPDPLMVLAEEDMNSFAPVSLNGKDLQAGFVKGYKLYRAFLTMPAAGRATLRFGRVQAAAAELFANGQPVATLRGVKGEWQVPLAAPAGQKEELRVRLFADGEAGGISDGVFLEN